VVIYVGNVLFKSGCPYLISAFNGNVSLADSVNKILLAGYYLINTGYTVIVLKVWERVSSFQQLMNILSMKTGTIILILGFMHLFNVLVLIKLSKSNKKSIHFNP
jgi:hypothetical protein